MEKDWEELPKTFTPAVRKRVLSDWQKCLPNLILNRGTLDYLIGPLLISIGFDIRLGHDLYRPTFSVHNILRDTEHLTATLNKILQTSRGTPECLTLRWHDKNYRDAAQRMKEQALIPLDHPTSLNCVLDVYKSFLEKEPYVSHIRYLNDLPTLAAWGGRDDIAKDMIAWGVQAYRELFGKSEEEATAWGLSMEEKIKDPEKLRQIAREQVAFHKLSKVPSCCFTDTPYQECLTKVPFPKA